MIILLLFSFLRSTCIQKVQNIWNWNTLLLNKEFIKQRLSIEHISTNLMIVDPSMKGLPPKIFSNHVERMDVMAYNC